MQCITLISESVSSAVWYSINVVKALRLKNTVGLLSFQEIEVGGSRKAIIIFVPVPQLKAFQKIQVRLVRELEKKFSGKHVVFIAQVKMCLFYRV